MRHAHSFWLMLVIGAIVSIVLVSTLHERFVEKPTSVTVDNLLLGTLVEIEAWSSELDEPTLRSDIQRAFDAIAKVESEMSLNVDGSAVRKINEAAGQGKVSVPGSLMSVLACAAFVSEQSGGAFDLTIGAVYSLWDFTSGNEAKPPDPEAIARNLQYVDYRRVELSATSGTVRLPIEGMRLDLGGIAKGYAVDVAARALSDAGVHDFIVNAGGDMFVSGRRPDGKKWRIGVRHPRLPGELMCTLLVTDRAVVTSGDYERFFEHQGKRFHHILDPATGYPAEACQSVTVVAKEAIVADALATAAFVMGPSRGLQLVDRLDGVEALVVDADGKDWHSRGFGEFLPGGPMGSP